MHSDRAGGARRRDRLGRVARSLGARVALLLGVALLPVGLIAVQQTLQVEREAEQRSELTLLALTEQAAIDERQLIQRSLGTAQALSGTVAALMAAGRCDEAMTRLVSEARRYSYAGYVARDGILVCSSGAVGHDFSGTSEFEDAIADPRPRVVVNQDAPLSGKSVIVSSHPVAEAEGGGFVFVSLPHDELGQIAPSIDLSTPVEMMTINAAGEVLTASGGLEGVAERLPEDRDLARHAGGPPEVFTGDDGLGRARAFTVVPIVPDTVYALGSWEAGGALAGPLGPAVPPWVFPILMWATSLLVAYVAVHRMVIRHMASLRARMRAFAEDRRLPEFGVSEAAPAEIAEMEADFVAMAERILREEAESENRLHEQKVLLREVHHRVKNNLQLICSIINMQIRQIGSPSARRVLRRVQDRVLGLATIHRNLYQTDMGTIRADVVLREIVGQLALLGGRAEDEVVLDFEADPVELYPDQAVPLSLFVTEAATNAVKYVGRPEDGRARIVISLTHEPASGMVEVAVINTKGTPLRPQTVGEDGTGLGNQLIRAFALQLDAAPDVVETPEAYRIALRFAAVSFEGAMLDAAQ